MVLFRSSRFLIRFFLLFSRSDFFSPSISECVAPYIIMNAESSVEEDHQDTVEIFRLPPPVQNPDTDTVPGFQYDGVLGALERMEIQSHQYK